MGSRRLLKAASAVREVVSTAILTEVQDPRVRDVTVTSVEVAPDMRSAKVHVSVRGDQKKQQLCLDGLRNSAGFLQHRIAQRIDTRYTPILQFVLDPGVKKSIEVATILREVLPREDDEDDNAEDGDETDDESLETSQDAAAESADDEPGEDLDADLDAALDEDLDEDDLEEDELGDDGARDVPRGGE